MKKLACLLTGLALIAILKYGPGKIDTYCARRGFYFNLLEGRAGALTPYDRLGIIDDVLCQCNNAFDYVVEITR